jgi:hypothetical protein
MKMFTLILLALCFSFDAHAFGRKPIRVPNPPEETEVIRARWETSQRDGEDWSKHVYQSLDSLGLNLLSKDPADVADFCPNYKNLSKAEKKNFWVYLLSSMTEFESGHRPETSYREAFFDAKGENVISRGLLQLSIESANAYGCGFQNAQEIHDPKKNLSCGIRILNRWVGNDQRLAGRINSKWLGGARYWSVLRFTNAPLTKIQSYTRAIGICR